MFNPRKPIKCKQLDREQRLNIIGGIAKVTLRELKASDILLYEAVYPKNSDLVWLRLFDRNETQGTTSRVVSDSQRAQDFHSHERMLQILLNEFILLSAYNFPNPQKWKKKLISINLNKKIVSAKISQPNLWDPI